MVVIRQNEHSKSGQIILFVPKAQRKSSYTMRFASERFNYHQFMRFLCAKSSLNYFRFLWFTFQGLSRFVTESVVYVGVCICVYVCMCLFECKSVLSFFRFITILLFAHQQSGKKENSIFFSLTLFAFIILIPSSFEWNAGAVAFHEQALSSFDLFAIYLPFVCVHFVVCFHFIFNSFLLLVFKIFNKFFFLSRCRWYKM